jgi:peptide/nickel transport system substrate-binding protein
VQLAAGTAVLGHAPRARSQAPTPGGVIRFAASQASPTGILDPAKLGTIHDGVLRSNVFETLVAANDKWEVTPLLAESWRSSPDGTEWTFRLREGVRFHDGTSLTARDVAYTLTRLLDKALGSPVFGRLDQSLTKEGIRAVDDRTLSIKTKQADVFLPLALAVRWMGIVKEGTAEFTVRTAIGTGPFKVTAFAPGQSWQAERHPQYWRRGLPYLDGIQSVAIPEQSTKVQSVISGDADICDPIDFSVAPLVQASAEARALELKDGTDLHVSMDASVKPFNDSRVTMAVKLAADRPRLLQTVFRGFGTTTSDVPVPASDPYYPPELPSRRQDIDRAKQLLSEAGYSGGLDAELYTSEAFGGMVDFAVAFAEVVRPAGIRLEIRKAPANTYYDQIWLKKPMYVSYNGRRHPSDMLPLVFASTAKWPEARLQSKKLDVLITDAARTTDVAKQTRLYQEAMLIIANEAAMHIPVFVNRLYASKKRLQGVKLELSKHLLFDEAFVRKA